MKKIIIIFTIFKLSIIGVFSQQNLTLYNMDKVLQSQFVNPSIDIQHKFHLGGLLIPIAGQLPPPIHFNYANNSFYYNHIFHFGEGSKADSLVLDLDLFYNKLKNTTHFRFETDIELLNLGIRLENMFLTVALTEKLRYGFSLPRDLFEFALNGNMPYMLESKPHDFKGFGIHFTHYRQLAVGASMDANDKFSFGGRAKILFGMANFNTDIKRLQLFTDPENYHMTWATDMKIQASLPIYFDYMLHQTDGHLDSVTFRINEQSIDAFTGDGAVATATKYLLNLRNIGMGFDLGVRYQFSPEIEFYGSVNDFGFITWNTNPQNFVSKGEYKFKGLQVQFPDSTDFIGETTQQLIDTLVNTFGFDLIETGYVTWLPTSIYLGGKYRYHDLLHFTALYRGEFFRKSYFQSLTLGVNSNLTNFLSAHLTYTIAHNYAGHLGFGLSARMGFMSWYFVTDSFTNMLFPQKAKNLNFRIGCNLVFGYKKIKSTASMRT